MVSFHLLLKAAKWFLLILFIDYLAYPLILPFIRRIPEPGATVYQTILFIVLTIITIAVPALIAISSEDDHE